MPTAAARRVPCCAGAVILQRCHALGNAIAELEAEYRTR
jgi:hypothetical protein